MVLSPSFSDAVEQRHALGGQGAVARAQAPLPRSPRRPGPARRRAACQNRRPRRDSMVVPLFINRDPDLDWLIALEYGHVCDGHPPEQFRTVGEQFAWMLDRPGGRRVIGFCVTALREFDPEAYRALWRGPRFDAPLFGLARARAGDIILATKAMLLDEPTT